MKSIKQHTADHHGGLQYRLAEACETTTQQVSKWVSRGFIVTMDGWVINPETTKRDLSIKEKQNERS